MVAERIATLPSSLMQEMGVNDKVGPMNGGRMSQRMGDPVSTAT